MARTSWLSYLKNRLLSQKRASRRKPGLLGSIRDWHLEDRCLLSAPQPTSIFVGSNEYFIGNNVKSDSNDVLLLSGKGMASGSYDWGAVPTKLFTFTNNNPKGGATIYPFLYDANNIQQYDPADPLHQEYRLYVGYTQDGKDYLGLPAGQSITINVPLVFWNAARANVATDGATLLPKDDQQGNFLPGIINPYGFYFRDQGPTNKGAYAAISIAPAESGGNGIVMYYRGTNNGAPVDPVDDAQGQLIEWTIRDQGFMTNKVNDYNSKNGIPLIPASDLLTHINYDVSNVDNLSSPVAMEATQVSVPIQYVQSGSIKSIQQNGTTTTTTIQLMNNIPADQAFLLQLMNSQPQSGPKPSWQVYYQKDEGSPRIDIGTVTNADKNTDLLTVTLNGGTVPQSLLNQN